MKQNHLFVSAVVAALVAAVVAFLFVMPRVPTDQPEPQPGATADISSPYLQWGGVSQYSVGVSPTATSSVFCSILLPTTAGTSTILGVSFRTISNGLGSQVFYISTSTTVVGSSSPALISAASIPAAGGVIAWQPGIQSTSSPDVLGNLESIVGNKGMTPFIILPGQRVNFRVATNTPGTFAAYLGGKCTARFQAL